MQGDCPTCGRFILVKPHVCPPQWRCWAEEDETAEDASTVRAYNAEAAAREYADDYDSENEGFIAYECAECVFCVQSAAGGEVLRFRVSGRMDPVYQARRIEE